MFLGASADVGIFKNCFGDANSFFRTASFLQFGGYSEDRNLGYEDWELYSRIAMDGYAMQVSCFFNHVANWEGTFSSSRGESDLSPTGGGRGVNYVGRSDGKTGF